MAAHLFLPNGDAAVQFSATIVISDLFEKVISQFPELNFLVNNAGVMRISSFHTSEVDLEDISSEIEINLSGMIELGGTKFKCGVGNEKSQKKSASKIIETFPTSCYYSSHKKDGRVKCQVLEM
ncbi:SDR family NAD(P)-dependent oxidoreductase [Paenibacillus sp. FSL L8-0158]|uniref:SDR family NAD(P)-dependent oxidoreductase n=1 Tax=Paenibacillus sp. FSL L8-0158 TaxID=2954752 RepID=UPI0031587DE5